MLSTQISIGFCLPDRLVENGFSLKPQYGNAHLKGISDQPKWKIIQSNPVLYVFWWNTLQKNSIAMDHLKHFYFAYFSYNRNAERRECVCVLANLGCEEYSKTPINTHRRFITPSICLARFQKSAIPHLFYGWIVDLTSVHSTFAHLITIKIKYIYIVNLRWKA